MRTFSDSTTTKVLASPIWELVLWTWDLKCGTCFACSWDARWILVAVQLGSSMQLGCSLRCKRRSKSKAVPAIACDIHRGVLSINQSIGTGMFSRCRHGMQA